MKRPWEIIAELLTPNIKLVLSKAFSVHKDTVAAWGRAAAAPDNPTATGKHGPLDQAERYIRIAHRYDPGNAREAANYYVSLVDELDRQAGISAAEKCEESPCRLIAESAKEHTDVVVLLAGKPHDTKSWIKALKEIPEAVSKLTELEGCLKKLLRNRGK